MINVGSNPSSYRRYFYKAKVNNRIDTSSVRERRILINVEAASRIPFGRNVLVEKEDDDEYWLEDSY